jgi:hypothetical protein
MALLKMCHIGRAIKGAELEKKTLDLTVHGSRFTVDGSRSTVHGPRSTVYRP